MSVAIVGWGAISPLGEGTDAFARDPGETRVVRDEELARAGLARPFCARAKIDGDRDRAVVLFERALAACITDLARAVPDWKEKRVGLAVGTSSGGMRAFETAPSSLEGTYLGPVLAAHKPRPFAPFAHVLGACASSTIAIGLARTWLDADECDLAIAGGYDAVSVFVATGFEVLRATSAQPGPRPFRRGRDGLALGEGAAFLALVRAENATTVRAYVTGFGATCDAVHLTAPDREGKGLARAARAACEEAGRPAIGLVSAHGTATEFNDASEAQAMRATLPGEPVVHAFKGTIGHTLGAAGALETLAAATAIAQGIAPPTSGRGEIDGDVRILSEATPIATRAAIKLSSAFGGANAALVVSRDPAQRRALRDVYVSSGALATEMDAAALAKRTGYAEDKIARADDLVRVAMSAVAALEDRVGSLRGAGIVVGHGLATIDTNARFQTRIRDAGPTRAEPRRFPYTTPNAPAGECAVAFGLTGPAFAVGGGPHGGIEALMVARDLVRAGTADRIVVVAVDEAGDASRGVAPDTKRGAVAVLVSSERLDARIEGCSVALGVGRAVAPQAMDAHRALLTICHERPASVEASFPGGGFANARLFWL